MLPKSADAVKVNSMHGSGLLAETKDEAEGSARRGPHRAEDFRYQCLIWPRGGRVLAVHQNADIEDMRRS